MQLPAQTLFTVEKPDRSYINQLRGFLILRVVLTHLGLSWFYLPYSSYVGIFFPALFFVSGVVTYFSFLGKKTTRIFIVRRLTRLFIPYLVITGIAFVLISRNPPSDLSSIFDWLFMNMKTPNEPYNLGQVWFLQSLVIITILAVPLYKLSKTNIHVLLIPVLLSFVLAIGQEVAGWGSYFWLSLGTLNSINLYHPLVNFGYFSYGAWMFSTGCHRKPRLMIIVSVFLCGTIFFLFKFTSIDPLLSSHSYFQDLYYMSLGYLGIYFLLVARIILEPIFSAKPINGFLNFFSYHAFVIYLVHSYFITFTEKYFGWEDITGDYLLILAKIAFVIAASCLAALPLSWLTKKLTVKLMM